MALWFGALEGKFLVFPDFCDSLVILGDDVKTFLLCRHAPLNISECCQVGTFTWFGTHAEAIVDVRSFPLFYDKITPQPVLA